MISVIQNRKNEFFLFTFLFIAIVFFLDYQSIFFLKPRSFHFIRQTDSLSFINYYLKTGLNFFNIGNLNLYNGSGKTACEFPLLYYIAALISKIGVDGFLILKAIYLIIFFLTSYLIYNFLRKSFCIVNSMSLTFLLFSSTIVLYYTLNYVPNYPSLCFTLIGLIYFLSYLESANSKEGYISCLFFLVAGLLKVTFTLYPVGCFIFLFFYFLKNRKINYTIVASFSLIFLLLILWNFFMVHYNKTNNANYYLTSIAPLWNTSDAERSEVLGFIFNYWLYKYYYQSTIHIFFIILIVSCFFYKKINLKHFVLSILFLFGVSCYFILFFKQFRDHDYYFMEFIPFFFIVFINSYSTITQIIPDTKQIRFLVSFSLLIITFLSLNYGKLNLTRRYEKPFEQVSKIAYVLEDVERKLDSIGISKDAKFLVAPDYTMNGSLYYLNRFGYTIGDTSNFNLVNYYEKSDYILITDSTYSNAMTKKFKLMNCLLSYRGSSLFKIVQ